MTKTLAYRRSSMIKFTHPIRKFPHLEKGGQGGFVFAHKSKSPSIPLFQRGRHDYRNLKSEAMHWSRQLAQFTILLVILGVSLPTNAQEKVIVGHSARAALSIGPLLYGIERAFTATKASIWSTFRCAPI